MRAKLPVVTASLDRSAVEELTRQARRSWWQRGSQEEVEWLGMVFWPVAVAETLAIGAGRHRWRERAYGAVDLVSRRTGLIDSRLEVTAVSPSPEDHVIVPRLRKEVAQTFWREYHRDRILRRFRPWKVPDVTHVGFERVYVAHHWTRVCDKDYLVDTMTQHAEELDHFPWVRDQVIGDLFCERPA